MFLWKKTFETRLGYVTLKMANSDGVILRASGLIAFIQLENFEPAIRWVEAANDLSRFDMESVKRHPLYEALSKSGHVSLAYGLMSGSSEAERLIAAADINKTSWSFPEAA